MSQTIELRLFQPDDAETLADVQRRALMAIHPRFYSRVELESLCAGIVPENFPRFAGTDVLRVALGHGGEVLGFGSARPDGKTGAIARLFSRPEAQGKGVGTALLSAAEADLIAHGAAHAQVCSSLSAVAFYEARGYQVLGRRTRPTSGSMDLRFCEMEKPL